MTGQFGGIEQLWWLFFGVTCVMYVLALGTLGVSRLRRRERGIGATVRTTKRTAAGQLS